MDTYREGRHTPMEYTMLINELLAAEREANAITGEMRAQQANLDSELAAEKERILAQYMAGARERLERLEQEEQRRKEQALAVQDARLAETSERMERTYARYGDNWVETLFHQVVDPR